MVWLSSSGVRPSWSWVTRAWADERLDWAVLSVAWVANGSVRASTCPRATRSPTATLTSTSLPAVVKFTVRSPAVATLPVAVIVDWTTPTAAVVVRGVALGVDGRRTDV